MKDIIILIISEKKNFFLLFSSNDSSSMNNITSYIFYEAEKVCLKKLISLCSKLKDNIISASKLFISRSSSVMSLSTRNFNFNEHNETLMLLLLMEMINFEIIITKSLIFLRKNFFF